MINLTQCIYIYYFEILHMKGGSDDSSVVSPFFSFEAEESITFKLLHQWGRFVFLVEFWLGGEDFADEVWIRDGDSSGGSKPDEECCTFIKFNHVLINELIGWLCNFAIERRVCVILHWLDYFYMVRKKMRHFYMKVELSQSLM